MYQSSGWGRSKELFNGSDSREYFSSFYQKMKAEVEKMSDAEITSCNMQEWVEFLTSGSDNTARIRPEP